MRGGIANKPACDILKAGIAAKRLKKVSYGGMGHCVDTRSACVSISILRHDAGFDFIDKPNRDRGEWKENAEIFRRGKFPLNPSDPAF
jgi:hypothetical protein